MRYVLVRGVEGTEKQGEKWVPVLFVRYPRVERCGKRGVLSPVL